MHLRRITSGFLALLALFLMAASAFAQFGLKPITKDEYQRIPKAKLPGGGYGELPSMDLSSDMPSPGNQNPQGSCAAWASSYAYMTYLVDRDHGWRPDMTTYEHVFSPAFIYNQRPRSPEPGMYFLTETLPLLQKKGCATWRTMPYVPLDEVSQPSPEAIREATQYRITSFNRVDSGAEIRKWLQARYPVLIGVRAAGLPTVNYDVFTKKTWNEARSLLSLEEQRMTQHAMCLVGYDDTYGPHGAFKVMNSWGSDWGPQHDGFVWFDYDLMRIVSPGDQNFCQEAYVLFTAAAGPKPPSGQSVTATGQSWYVGFQNGEHTWGWKAFLQTASAQTLERITRVVWKVPDVGGSTSEVASADPGLRFEVGGQLRKAGSYTVLGTVYFRDGARREVSCKLELQPPAPSARALKLAQSDRFWATIEGTPYYEFTLRLDGNINDLQDVKQVTYHLHPTFREPKPVVRQSPENGFAYTTTAYGTFLVKATVLFRDDTTLELKMPLRFHDQVHDDLVLTNTAQPLGRWDDGKFYYSWTAFLQGPARRLKEVKSIRYILHPSFNKQMVDVDSGVEHGFPLTAIGWGRFPLKATVLFQDGSTQDLSHDLRLSPADGPPSPEKGGPRNHLEPSPGPDPSAPPSPRKDDPGAPVNPPRGPNPPRPVEPSPERPEPVPNPPGLDPSPALPPSPPKGQPPRPE